MGKRRIILLFVFSTVFSSGISAQRILRTPSSFRKGRKDTTPSHGDLFPIRPFTYKINTLALPDSLGGKCLNVTIRLTAWVDSFARLLSIHPTSIAFYLKKNPNKLLAIYNDKVEITQKWENTPFFVQRYIYWISKVLPGKIRFSKVNSQSSSKLRILPLKARNYVPVVIYLK